MTKSTSYIREDYSRATISACNAAHDVFNKGASPTKSHKPQAWQAKKKSEQEKGSVIRGVTGITARI